MTNYYHYDPYELEEPLTLEEQAEVYYSYMLRIETLKKAIKKERTNLYNLPGRYFEHEERPRKWEDRVCHLVDLETDYKKVRKHMKYYPSEVKKTANKIKHSRGGWLHEQYHDEIYGG